MIPRHLLFDRFAKSSLKILRKVAFQAALAGEQYSGTLQLTVFLLRSVFQAALLGQQYSGAWQTPFVTEVV